MDFAVISTGDISRKRARKDESIRKIIDNGGLLSDETITGWVEDEIKEIPKGKNLIFNGYPRDLNQAKHLEKILEVNDRELKKAIFLKVPEDELVYRLTERVYCKICGKKVMMDREDCIVCGGEVIKRSDDNPESILNRIKIFDEKTRPLLKYYDQKKKLIEIDGARRPEVILEETLKRIEEV